MSFRWISRLPGPNPIPEGNPEIHLGRVRADVSSLALIRGWLDACDIETGRYSDYCAKEHLRTPLTELCSCFRRMTREAAATLTALTVIFIGSKLESLNPYWQVILTDYWVPITLTQIFRCSAKRFKSTIPVIGISFLVRRAQPSMINLLIVRALTVLGSTVKK